MEKNLLSSTNVSRRKSKFSHNSPSIKISLSLSSPRQSLNQRLTISIYVQAINFAQLLHLLLSNAAFALVAIQFTSASPLYFSMESSAYVDLENDDDLSNEL